MIFNTVGVLLYLVFFLPYHVATDFTQLNYVFPMNVIFFVLINYATVKVIFGVVKCVLLKKVDSYREKRCNHVEIFMNYCQNV